MKQVKFILPLLLLFAVFGNVWGAEYSYKTFAVSFNKGTTNGTNISGQISTTTNVSTYSSSGSGNLSSKATAASNVYYNASGAGIRISKSSGAGSIQFTLNDALKDSTIYAIVVYASKVSGNTKAVLDVTPAGGYTTKTSYANGNLSAYSTSKSANSNYKLDTIKVGGKKLTTLTFASASGGYTHLHGFDIITQTAKSAPAPSTYTLVYAANGGSGEMTDSKSPYSAGAEVTLMANTFTAPTGKRWDSWKVTDASSNNVTVTDGKITMPASNVTVTAQWVDACSRSITISKGSETNGTFTLGTTGSVCIDGGDASTTVTCSPNAHYHVREVTSTGGGSVTGSGNSWTVSNISANTTINVTFEEDTKYTVIFKNAGTQVSSKQVYANEAIGALPEKGTMESCDNSSTTFMGWTTATISEKTSTEPTYVTAETVVDHDNYVVNAVWAREED